MSTGFGVFFIVIVIVFIIWCVYKFDIDSKKEELEKQEQLKLEEQRQLQLKIKQEERLKLEEQRQLQLKQEESFEIAVINRIKRFIKNNTDLFNSLKYIFDSAKNLYENNLWCWDSLTLSYGHSIELIYSVETNKFYIGYSYGSWSAYIDSCFSENNLIFFSKKREFKSGYGFKTTIKNNLNYHTLYSMLKYLKESIEYILYNFKSYTEED